MKLKAGTTRRGISGEDQYASSLASAIEDAFMQEWPAVMNNADAPAPNNQMRLLFIAVAQGLIRYLKNNQDAITVAFSTTDNRPVNIATEGPLYETET